LKGLLGVPRPRAKKRTWGSGVLPKLDRVTEHTPRKWYGEGKRQLPLRNSDLWDKEGHPPLFGTGLRGRSDSDGEHHQTLPGRTGSSSGGTEGAVSRRGTRKPSHLYSLQSKGLEPVRGEKRLGRGLGGGDGEKQNSWDKFRRK